MKNPVILLIENEPDYRNLLEPSLARQGYRVLVASDGAGGLALSQSEAPDLVLLDLKLPDVDGFEVCRQLRARASVPIILLSAYSEGEYEIRGLALGADDYVTKPFHIRELLARIAAVLQRSRRAIGRPVQAFSTGDLRIEFPLHRVSIAGRVIHLSPREYKLLYQLAAQPDQVLVYEELLSRVWGATSWRPNWVLHTTIRRLRRKIEADPAKPRYILTQRGIGFYLAAGATTSKTSEQGCLSTGT